MTPEKIKALEAADYRVGTVAEFLELTPDQSARVEDAAAKLTAELSADAEQAGTKTPRVHRTRIEVAASH